MKFTLNDEGLERLLSSSEAEQFLTSVAHEVEREWKRLDPRSKPGGHEPPEIQVGPPERDRGVAVVPVFTTDGIWHIIEYGSINNPPYRPATKAAQNAGLELKDSR